VTQLGLPRAHDDPDSQLVRVLGARQLTANIFNYTVGSGIFVLPAFAVAQIGGAAPLAYVACAVVMALVLGAVAVWRLRARNVRTERTPFLMPGGMLVPFMACIVIASIVTQAITQRELVALAAVLALSLVMYVVQRRRSRPTDA
jgi:amino acid transporter